MRGAAYRILPSFHLVPFAQLVLDLSALYSEVPGRCQLSTFLRLCEDGFERLQGRRGTENQEDGELAVPVNLSLLARLVSVLLL